MSLSRFEKTLLQRAAQDAPSPERKRAARAAVLGAAGVAAAAALGETTANAAANTTTASAAATTTASVSSFSLKLVLFAALTAALALTAVVALQPPPATPDASSGTPTTSSVAPVAPPVTLPPPPEPSTADPPRAEPSPMPVVAISAVPNAGNPPRARASATSSASAVREDPVAGEARLLEAARACLVAGDRACARARLAERERRYATGSLGDEAAVLAIDLALADEDRPRAQALARALVARNPSGAWSSRVRKLAEVPFE
jgi:hypothetical protein